MYLELLDELVDGFVAAARVPRDDSVEDLGEVKGKG